MSTFKLNPTIVQSCPKCQRDIHIRVAPGPQFATCGECATRISVELPASPVQKILALCKEMEDKIGGLISFRERD